MAKINNDELYRIKRPHLLDYVIGTDFYDLGRTVNFRMADIMSGGASQMNGLVMGGAIWVEGMTYQVTDIAYFLHGVLHTADATLITLDNSDQVFGRIDVIVANMRGEVYAIKGVPSPDPVKPQIGVNEIEVTFVYILAESSFPEGVARLPVYREGDQYPTEFNHSTTIGGVNFKYEADVRSGSFSMFYEDYSQRPGTITFHADEPLDINDYLAIHFYIKLPIASPGETEEPIRILFEDPDGNAGFVNLRHGNYGMDFNNIEDYQSISVYLNQVSGLPRTISKIIFAIDQTWLTPFIIDDFDVVSGNVPPQGSDTWLNLRDVFESSYFGKRGYIPIVRPGEDGLHLVDPSLYVGQDGKSPYDIYLEHTADDPVMTESEWLESLKGPQGEDGQQGHQGEQGPIGPEGPQGPIGPIGPQGEQGVAGRDGVDGRDGLDGQQGPQGEQGPIGPIGPQGEQGPPGPDADINRTSQLTNDGEDGILPFINANDLPKRLSDLDDDIGATLPFQYNTYFVDCINGNNDTGMKSNPTKPYRTIDAVLALLTDGLGESVTIQLLVNGVYPINTQIPANNIEIYTLNAVTIDLSANTNGYLFVTYNHGNFVGKSSLFLNTPNATIKNDRGGATGVRFAQSQCDYVLNIKKIDWNCSNSIFHGRSIEIIKLSELDSVGKLLTSLTMNQGISLNVIKAKSTGLLDGIIGEINVNTLELTNGNQLGDGQIWNIGNITGTANFVVNYFGGKKATVNFRDTICTNGFAFSQTLGTVIFSGRIKNMNILGTMSSGNIIFKNITVEEYSWNGRKFGATLFNLSFESSVINSAAELFSYDGSNVFVKFRNSVVQQLTPGYLIWAKNRGVDIAGISEVSVGGLETNATSIGNDLRVEVDFQLQSFKDKKNEMVIRSKVDIMNKSLDVNSNYLIDGKLTLGSGEFIIVPPGGNLTINGYGLELSTIEKNVPGESIFISPVGGSGGLQMDAIKFIMGTPTTSCFDLTDESGFNAVECVKVNFEGSGRIGTLSGYRQGLWSNIGLFELSGGLKFNGPWRGGLVTDKVIARNLSGTSGVMFEEGAGLTFDSRFSFDGNIDIPTGWAVADFNDSNFTNAKTFQIKNAVITRAGVYNENDTGYFPNISEEDRASDWTGNVGVKNSSDAFLKLKSPNGTVYRVEISNAGSISATPI